MLPVAAINLHALSLVYTQENFPYINIMYIDSNYYATIIEASGYLIFINYIN